MKKIIITIDGHSACGKSTLAKDLADQLKYGYIDTGAMYRAVTYFFLENRVNIQKTTELERALKKINISFKNTIKGNRTFLNGKDVEDVIRKMFVSKNVSHVSAISAIRKVIVKQQKEMGKDKGIVMEGRDIGTVVFPNAELKLFLTADEEVRIKRRYDDLKNKGQSVSMKSVKSNLTERDLIDSTRKDSPLMQAKEAIIIDNTNLTPKEQLHMCLALANERIRRLSEKTLTQKKAAIVAKNTKSTPQKNLQTKKNQKKPTSTTQKNQPKKVPTSAAKNTPRQDSQPSHSNKKNPKTQENKKQKSTSRSKNNPQKSRNQQSKQHTKRNRTSTEQHSTQAETPHPKSSVKKNTRSQSAPNPQKKQNTKAPNNRKNTKPNPPKNLNKKTSSDKSPI